MASNDGANTGRGRRILLVEDHADSALVMSRLLERMGFRITTADTLASARARAGEDSFDLLICDIGLPDTDGYELAAALRNNPATARARLIAVTAYGAEQDKQRSREVGFQLHLVKPVRPEKLLEELGQSAKTAGL